MKPNVCIDARMLFSSGIGTYLQNIIPRIAPFFNLSLLVLNKDLFWNKEICSIACNAPIYSIQEQLFLPKKIPPCHLYWSAHYNIPLLPISAQKRAVTIHDICHVACPQFFPFLKRKIARKVIQSAIHQSDLVMTVSEFSKQEILSHFSYIDTPIHIVPGAAEEKKEPNSAFKSSLQLTRPFILYVGSHRPHKNAEGLCKAFQKINEEYDLIIVTPKHSSLKKYPRVHYVHELSAEELSFLYKKAKLLALPSLYEGFGLVPLEAMQRGCPVLVSNLASFPEVCQDAAYYVNPYDTLSIYTGIKALLEHDSLRKDLIKKGFKRVKNFSWDRSAHQIKELFYQAIDL